MSSCGGDIVAVRVISRYSGEADCSDLLLGKDMPDFFEPELR